MISLKIRTIATIIALTIATAIVGYTETHYTREAVVVDIDTTTDEVIVVDFNGHKWSFVGNGYNINDTLVLTMNTNHTDNVITDDTIEDAKIINN